MLSFEIWTIWRFISKYDEKWSDENQNMEICFKKSWGTFIFTVI